MRFPFSKAYRAFPELDRFSDAECEGFIRLAKTRSRLGRLVAVVAGLVLAFMVVMAGSLLAYGIAESVARSGSHAMRGVAMFIVIVGLIASVLIGPMFGIMLYRTWLRATIESLVLARRCGACSYSLLGLPVIDGGITCPECGQRFDLAARGLSAADVLAQPDHSTHT